MAPLPIPEKQKLETIKLSTATLRTRGIIYSKTLRHLSAVAKLDCRCFELITFLKSISATFILTSQHDCRPPLRLGARNCFRHVGLPVTENKAHNASAVVFGGHVGTRPTSQKCHGRYSHANISSKSLTKMNANTKPQPRRSDGQLLSQIFFTCRGESAYTFKIHL